MKIKYKLFPYPVLASQIDDYINNNFDGKITVSKNLNSIQFNFELTIDDEKIVRMIKIGDAEIIYHFECSKTLYRQIFKTNTLSEIIDINEKRLNGKVEICCLIVAKRELRGYSNSNFNDEYGDTKFNIKKGNILGFFNFPIVSLLKNTEELAKVSSIFSIHHRIAKDELGMQIEIDEQKIEIWLADEEYQRYSDNANDPVYQPMLHAMLVFPALLYALDMILVEGTDIYEDFRWFKAMQFKLKESGIELTQQTIRDKKPFWIAQKILNLPINRAMKNMVDRVDEEDE